MTPPKLKGFGIELLDRTTAFELKRKTTLTHIASGLHCTIVVPSNCPVVHTPAPGA